MKRRVWNLVGPPLLAVVLVGGLLLTPLPLGRLSPKTMQAAEVSMSPNVFLGQRIKDQALAEHAVPFLGSSEWTRMDPFHPATLAAKYHRSYRPLLLGAAGSQSLSHYLNDQSWIGRYRDKQVVMVVSPQWFTKAGVPPAAFQYYYSPLQAILFAQHAKPTSKYDRYAATRLLQLGPKKGGTVHTALLTLAAGQPLSPSLRWRLGVTLTLLQHQDALFSRLALNHREKRIEAGMRRLPPRASDAQLDRLAAKVGAKASRNNDLGIDDHFYAKRLSGDRLAKLRGSQRHFDYRRSPEYTDFELLLHQFAQNHIQVQFIIPPMNRQWARYTGLSTSMYAQTAAKIKHQLTTQGFTRVLDLSQTTRPYMMEDTIHLGWRGWVAVDRVVAPFLTQPQAPAHYHLDAHYLTKAWANETR